MKTHASCTLSLLLILMPALLRAEAPSRAVRIEAQINEGEFESAHTQAAQWLVEAQDEGDRSGEAWATEMLGNALFYLDSYREARDAFDRALVLMRAAGDRYGEAIALKDAGIARKYTGDFTGAFERLDAARGLFEAQQKHEELASVLENIGMAYQTLGDRDRAMALYKQTLRIWKSLDSAPGIQGALARMGFLYLDAGASHRAEECFVEAIGLQGGLPIDRAWLLSGLSSALADSGRIDEAIEACEQALELNLRHGRALYAATDLRVLAWLTREGDPERATEYLKRARTIYDLIPSLPGWRGNAAAGEVYQRLGDLDRAIEHYEVAAEQIESVRAGLRQERQRTGLVSQHQGGYVGAIDALMERHLLAPERGDDRKAFEMLDRARARAMAEAIAEARAGEEEIGDAGQPLSLREVQSMLDQRAALLAYAITHDAVYAFAVTADVFHAERLDVEAGELAERVGNYIDLLAGENSEHALQPIGLALYRDLVKPLHDRLPAHIERLVVVPDGALSYLPFEALITRVGEGSAARARYLLEDLSISYSPSAGVLRELQRSRRDAQTGADLLAVANPSFRTRAGGSHDSTRSLFSESPSAFAAIPFAETEVRVISRYAGEGSRVLIGSDAVEDRVKDLAGDGFSVIHFATHGIVSARRAGHAALLLTPGDREDGLLEADEIYRMRIPSQLVVISACETARGRLLDGEGVQSLARAFFYAGARAVVASLWKVDDIQTARLMKTFYARLADGRSEADALAEAKRELLHADPHSRPRDWAAFIALGDADRTVAIAGLAPWRRHGWWLVAAGVLLSALLAAGVPRAGRWARPR